jgi:hypothetical protein
MQATARPIEPRGAWVRASGEALLLRILYATVIVVLYPALDSWWELRTEAAPSVLGNAGSVGDRVPARNDLLHGTRFGADCSMPYGDEYVRCVTAARLQ